MGDLIDLAQHRQRDQGTRIKECLFRINKLLETLQRKAQVMTKLTINQGDRETVRYFEFAYLARNQLLLSGFLPTEQDRHLWKHPYTGHTATLTFNQVDEEMV